jgi:hypothetical protein
LWQSQVLLTASVTVTFWSHNFIKQIIYQTNSIRLMTTGPSIFLFARALSSGFAINGKIRGASAGRFAKFWQD